jgi:uncharacterized protein
MQRVHVSIHDISPAFEPEIRAALELCHERGIKPALLVVPNFHGAHPLGEHPAFCAWVRELQAQGHEIFLHGFFHLAGAGAQDETSALTQAFRQRVVSAGEAEFAALAPADAERLLDDGLAVLESAGLRPSGFVPPAWSMSPGLLPMLARRGLSFCEDHFFVYDPVAARRRPNVVLNYASRSPARLLSTVAYCRAAVHAAGLLGGRIAIHPKDMRFTLLRTETEWLLGQVQNRIADTGQALLAA